MATATVSPNTIKIVVDITGPGIGAFWLVKVRALRRIHGNGVGCEGGFILVLVEEEDGGLGVVVEGVEGGGDRGTDVGGDEGLGDFVGNEVEFPMPEKKRVWVKRTIWGKDRSGGGGRFPIVLD
ncbi:hypothetical protein RHSIM_Rhsim04G0041400 [Rhododendron simsii]|uniref:Uncharacterized protein n=1 Tax=Rhododendron simsii TaxID=118357 RepID=A0A834LR97_RHOSS|nr:hypothetical protein RHSIM_Rhsim04G0041400 [Rhododendron simsii]